MKDDYPSRHLKNPALIDRPDPVLWAGKKNSGPLPSAHMEKFEQDGFLFFPRFFSESDVSQFKDEFSRLSSFPALEEDPRFIREPGSRIVRSIFSVHEISPLFKRLSQDPRLADITRQILDSDVYIHQSRINLKPGFSGKEFYWHSDFETWHAEDGMPQPRAVSCAILLTENNEFNGPLMVIPGSHKKFAACPGATPENHFKTSLQKQEYGVPPKESILGLMKNSRLTAPKGPAGSLLVFDSNLMHGSSGNISPFPRSNIFFCYNSIKNRLSSPFGAQKPRPEYVASRNFSPIEKTRELATA